MAQFDPKAGAEQATYLAPSGAVSNPAGFVAPAIVQSNHPPAVKRMLAKVAEKLANDPMAMREFCDRIYQLLRDDIQTQQERSYGYGRRH